MHPPVHLQDLIPTLTGVLSAYNYMYMSTEVGINYKSYRYVLENMLYLWMDVCT